MAFKRHVGNHLVKTLSKITKKKNKPIKLITSKDNTKIITKSIMEMNYKFDI